MPLSKRGPRSFRKYDLKAGKDTGVVKLDFMPDNLTWTKNRHMLAAGVKGARGECPGGSGTPCIVTFGVAEIDPANMKAADGLRPPAAEAARIRSRVIARAFRRPLCRLIDFLRARVLVGSS